VPGAQATSVAGTLKLSHSDTTVVRVSITAHSTSVAAAPGGHALARAPD
jgi:hypothetical protein